MNKAEGFYALEAKSIDGKQISFSTYNGKVALVVNTASKCGLTPQYEALEKIYDKYKDKGFVILGFPSNDFLWQEPGTDEELKKFCQLKYDISFPMFTKNPVKGSDKQPVYKYLTEQTKFTGEIEWNFSKFLVGKNGEVIGRFPAKTKPDAEEVIAAIEKAL